MTGTGIAIGNVFDPVFGPITQLEPLTPIERYAKRRLGLSDYEARYEVRYVVKGLPAHDQRPYIDELAQLKRALGKNPGIEQLEKWSRLVNDVTSPAAVANAVKAAKYLGAGDDLNDAVASLIEFRNPMQDAHKARKIQEILGHVEYDEPLTPAAAVSLAQAGASTPKQAARAYDQVAARLERGGGDIVDQENIADAAATVLRGGSLRGAVNQARESQAEDDYEEENWT